MSVEAPLSRHRKTNLKIYIIVCLVFTVWFGYDGYFNQKFIQEHTGVDGPDSTLAFNKKAPPFCIAAAVLLTLHFLGVRNRKIVADENELVISSKEKIPYQSIEKIDKTHFKARGFFVITYNNDNGQQAVRRLSDKNYDNLGAVLDLLVARIS